MATNRPVVYGDLNDYIRSECKGGFEFWKGDDKGNIEFRVKLETEDGHQGEFACWVSRQNTSDDKAKMLKCVQQGHDWRESHTTPQSLPA